MEDVEFYLEVEDKRMPSETPTGAAFAVFTTTAESLTPFSVTSKDYKEDEDRAMSSVEYSALELRDGMLARVTITQKFIHDALRRSNKKHIRERYFRLWEAV